jgi:hypothetical protein
VKRDAGRRTEFLLYTLYCAFLVIFSRAYWPTKSEIERLHLEYFILLSVLCLCIYIAPIIGAMLRGMPRLLKAFLLASLILPGAFLMHRMTLFGLGVLAILSLPVSVGLVVLESLILIFIKWRSYATGGKYSTAFRISCFSALFINIAVLIPVSMILWHPPLKSERDNPVAGGAVTKLTSPELSLRFSTPYDLLYLDNGKILVVSFKMVGNQMLSFWDKPNSNRLLAIKLADLKKIETSILPLTGTLMPECIAALPGSDLIFVTRVGFRNHAVTKIDIGGFPKLKVVENKIIDFEPNGVALSQDSASLIVTGIEGAVATFDPQTMKEKRRRLRIPVSAGINAIDTFKPAGADAVFLAMVGGKVTEINITTGKMVFADVGFGGGQLAADRPGGKLYQTDILFNKLNVIDIGSMKLVKRLPLGYKPRAVWTDPARDLLMIGDWFGGRVFLYRMSTLKPLGKPAVVGKYVRNFAYDQGRGLLFCACLGGVYMVDIRNLLMAEVNSYSK